jgi:hypothetical protein
MPNLVQIVAWSAYSVNHDIYEPEVNVKDKGDKIGYCDDTCLSGPNVFPTRVSNQLYTIFVAG